MLGHHLLQRAACWRSWSQRNTAPARSGTLLQAVRCHVRMHALVVVHVARCGRGRRLAACGPRWQRLWLCAFAVKAGGCVRACSQGRSGRHSITSRCARARCSRPHDASTLPRLDAGGAVQAGTFGGSGGRPIQGTSAAPAGSMNSGHWAPPRRGAAYQQPSAGCQRRPRTWPA